ncbi:MAG: YdaU family protein, partial [Planctomycetes bacterium]|nr:YdaU family protein [Planctomycetota bacterium]
HLTLEEDGAYNRLLRLMWMTPNCSLPNDTKWIMRRMRISQQIYDDVVRVIIDEFMIISKGRIINKRLLEEYQKTSVAHGKRVEAGRKGGNANALRSKKKPPSNAKAMRKQPEPEPKPELYKKGTKVPKENSEIVKILEQVLSPLMAKKVEKYRREIYRNKSNKKIPLTSRAANMLVNSLKQIQNPDDGADMFMDNQYQTFHLDAYQREQQKSNGNGNGQYKTKADRNQDSVDKAREWFNELQDKPQPPKMKAIN